MDIEILRGEIERLFSLDELTALSRDLLGLDPEEIGGTSAKASFARALTDRCSQLDALDALVEAVIGSRTDADPRLRDLNQRGFSVGETLAARVKRDGPIHIQEARAVLRNVLEALAALHERGIAHGNLKLENVIVSRASHAQRVLVVDGGFDRLRLRARSLNGHSQYL